MKKNLQNDITKSKATIINKAIVLSSILLFFAALTVTAQKSGSEVIGPSPTVAGLGKYATYPVNLSTGVPNIDIPVYTVPGRSINVPMSLSYHASGIKVEEAASWVGLGWSLNAGGVITRAVRGIADEEQFGYFETVEAVGYVPNEADNYDDAILDAAAKGTKDFEPDLFIFNFMGYVGRFTFIYNENNEWEIFLMSQSDMHIEWDRTNNNNEWTVTTPDGTQYIFGGQFIEVQKTPYSFENPEVNNTAWYLKEIIAVTGEKITLNYQESIFWEKKMLVSQSDRILKPSDYDLVGCEPGGGGGVTLQDRVFESWVLESIESDFMKVNFITDTRIDLNPVNPDSEIENMLILKTGNPKRLSQIQIFSKKDLVTPIKRFEFDNNDYFSDAQCGQQLEEVKFKCHRLKLNALRELPGTGNQGIKEHTFSYLIQDYSQELPSRNSSARDHWGYFNNSYGMLPEITEEIIQANPEWTQFYLKGGGGNKNADEWYMLAGSLKQITYPTGGYTKFNFEANRYMVEKTTVKESIEIVDGAVFVIDQPTEVIVDYLFTANANYYSSFDDPYLRIENSNDNLIFHRYFNPEISDENNGNYPDINPFFTLSGAEPLGLAPGTYHIHATNIEDGEAAIKSSASGQIVYWTELEEPEPYEKKIGGLRIASIENYDGINPEPSIKSFRYEDPVIFDDYDPKHYIYDIEEYQVDPQGEEYVEENYGNDPDLLTDPILFFASHKICTFLERRSSSKALLGTYQGGPIGYKKVTVFNGNITVDQQNPDNDTGENGKTVSYFEISDDCQGGLVELIFPFAPPPDCRPSWLKKQEDFDKNGKLVKKLENNYAIETVAVANGIRAKYVYNNPFDKKIGRTFYWVNSEWKKHLYTQETLYDQEDPNRAIVTRTDFLYDESLPDSLPKYYFQKGSMSVTSEGDSIKTINKYPEDYTPQGVIQTMIDRNMVQLPIESFVLKKKEGENTFKVTSAGKTEFSIDVNNKIFPIQTKRLEINTPIPEENINDDLYQIKTNFNYDMEGNVRHIENADGTTKLYIWDYVGKSPIAEVVCKQLETDAAYTGFENDDDTYGGWILSDENLVVANDGKTGNASYSGDLSKPILIVDKYIVTLWAKGNGTVSVNNITQALSGDWKLHQWVLDDPVAVNITSGGNQFQMDEVRLHPFDAYMSTYTYGKYGLTAVSDPNNTIAYYEYDDFGRLKLVRDHKGNIRSMYEYKYESSNE